MRHVLGGRQNLAEIETAERDEDQEHPQQESEVSDSVDYKRLLAGIARGLLKKVEADQQVGAQTHAFPANEHHQVIRAEHQNQHEEHEEIQVREEAVISALVRHIPGCVDVN